MEQPIITQKTYSTSKIKKLVDLNHDMINFKVTFTLSSDEVFKALIVNQSTLDNISTDDLEYKTVQGSMSGEIVADKNVYQNYYIILKSDIPASVNVELATVKLPDYIKKTSNLSNDQVDSYDTTKLVTYSIIGIVMLFVLYYITRDTVKNNPTATHQSLLSKLKRISNQ